MTLKDILDLYNNWSKNSNIKVDDVIDYSISHRMSSQHLWDLYSDRYKRYMLKTGKSNIAYEDLLYNLTRHQIVNMCTLQLADGTYLIITNQEATEILGVLGTV